MGAGGGPPLLLPGGVRGGTPPRKEKKREHRLEGLGCPEVFPASSPSYADAIPLLPSAAPRWVIGPFCARGSAERGAATIAKIDFPISRGIPSVRIRHSVCPQMGEWQFRDVVHEGAVANIAKWSSRRLRRRISFRPQYRIRQFRAQTERVPNHASYGRISTILNDGPTISDDSRTDGRRAAEHNYLPCI